MPDDHRAGLEHELRSAQQRRSAAREAGDTPARILAARDCGRAHFELGDTDLPFAQRLFGEAISLIEESGAHRELLPELLGMIGRTLQRMKRWDQVNAWYRRAAEEAGRQGLPAQELRWLVKEATTTLDMREPDTGRALLAQAIERGRAGHAAGKPVAETLIDALQRLALLDTTDEAAAITLWSEIDALLEELPPGRAHYEQAINRAAWHANHDRPLVAETYLEEALERAVALGMDGAERVEIGRRRAALLRQANEPVQAGDRLLDLLPHCLDDRSRHEVLTQAVDAYFAGNAWAPMHAAAMRLRELRRQTLGPGWQYDAAMRCAVASRGLADHEGALVLLKEALDLATASGRPEWITAARGQTAIQLLDAGRAADSAAIGEVLWNAGERNPLGVRTFVRALIAAGDLDRAEGITENAERGGLDPLEVARLRAWLADAGRGNPRQAWEAVAVAAGRDPATQSSALTRLLAVTPPGPDRFEQARHRLRLLDRARMRVNVFSDASWRATIEDADSLPGWLDDLVIEAMAGDQDETAIYEMERFRAQTLVNLLAERRAAWTTDQEQRGWYKAALTTRVQRERLHLRALAARGVGWRERRAVAEDIAGLARAALTAEGLIHFAPNDLGINFPGDLAELLGDHRLAADECLLFAHALPDRLAVWARRSDGTTLRTTLPGMSATMVARLGGLLRGIGGADPQPDVAGAILDLDDACGTTLAAWLTGLGVRRAFLSAGTAMAGLPIDCCAAFLSPGAPELVLLPTAAALGFVRGRRAPSSALFRVTKAERVRAARALMKASRGQVLVVVDPSHDLDFAPLEGAVVTSVYAERRPGARRSASTLPTVIDQPVTDPTALAAACSRADVLHFVGHGDFDDANPYLSGLTVAPPGAAGSLWTNGDIFSGVDAPAGRLAVLSGCETGHTLPNLVSEEVSLPAAFIAAGYAAVVASRWAVDDLSATLLMADFHARWNSGGISVASALAASRNWLRTLGHDQAATLLAGLAGRAAHGMPERADECRWLCKDARALLDEEGEWPFADPLYWAAFHVTGDGAITADGADLRVP